MTRLLRTAVLTMTLLCSPLALSAAFAESPDLILRNGEVITMDPANPQAQALAISGERIVAVGSNQDIDALAAKDTRVVDLAGKTVIPGLIDTHMHAIRAAQTFDGETLWLGVSSLQDGLDVIRREAERRGPGAWIAVVGGWHPRQFVENRMPTIKELNDAAPNNPVYVQYLYDEAFLNAKAVEALGITSETKFQPGGYPELDAQGKPTGVLRGNIPAFSGLSNRILAAEPAQRLESSRRFFSELNGLGITSVIDAGGGGMTPPQYDTIFQLWQQGGMSVRVAYRISAPTPDNEAASFKDVLGYMPPSFGDTMLRFAGLGEVLVWKMHDGEQIGPGFKSSDAAKGELLKVLQLAAARGYQVEIHAFSNDAGGQILDIVEKVNAQTPVESLRWTVTHLTDGTEQTFSRMKAMGMSYTVQDNMFLRGQDVAGKLGDEAAEILPPIRKAMDLGLVVAGGSDATRVSSYNPMIGLQWLVDGRSVGGSPQRIASDRLTREEALALYTRNAAWVMRRENELGTLATGRIADLAVLDKPYMTMPVEDIHGIRSVLTLLGGKVVHDAAATR